MEVQPLQPLSQDLSRIDASFLLWLTVSLPLLKGSQEPCGEKQSFRISEDPCVSFQDREDSKEFLVGVGGRMRSTGGAMEPIGLPAGRRPEGGPPCHERRK
eukprot:760894-Hanusia_phi.AAC.1